MPKVILLCGKIASGKTTYANRLKKAGGTMLLSCDDLLLTLFEGCLGDRHDDITARSTRFFYSQAQELTNLGLNVVLDFGFWKKTDRSEALEYFKSRGIPVELHYIHIPEKDRLQRLAERNRLLKASPTWVYIIDEELLKVLDAKFEEPLPEEIDVRAGL